MEGSCEEEAENKDGGCINEIKEKIRKETRIKIVMVKKLKSNVKESSGEERRKKRCKFFAFN